jgi:hypothetical protein
VWAWILEGCAEIVGANASGRRLPAVLATLAVAVLALVLGVAFGWRGLAPLAFLVLVVHVTALDVFRARDALWRAAVRPLDDPTQAPSWAGDPRITAPSAVALHRLSRAIDHARRGAFVAASDLAPIIDRDLLRAEELRLLDAVRALVSTGLGDEARAAQLAAVALPTGSDAIDAQLGRVLLARAWDDPARLRAIDAAWRDAGVRLRQAGALPELRRLTRIRLEPPTAAELVGADARPLAEHARAIGDDGLATELEVASRPAPYR